MDALNFDYFDSVAALISSGVSHAAKSRGDDPIASFQSMLGGAAAAPAAAASAAAAVADDM